MKKLRFYSLTILLCFIAVLAIAQNTQVQGIVNDQEGTLAGVTVAEKGVPTNATATTAEGKFKLTLRGTSRTLIIRLLGYETKEVKVGSKSDLAITMEANTQALSEVAIVGYGAVPKKTLTGAQSAVSGNDIRENPSASLQNTLAGRITGFISQQTTGQPGVDGASFLVRGQSSLNGNNNPLIIVDDIEFDYAQFANLDANDVESVTVLKDASQTAVYGIKGANGVIVVTTRRGKIGKPRISARVDYSLSQPTILPTYLDAYNTAVLYNQANVNDGLTPRWNANDLALFQNGQDPYGHPNINWYDELFKKFADQTKATFDVQGGTNDVKYFVSLGYVNQGGTTKDFSSGQDYNSSYYNHRYNYRTNLNIKINKSLNLTVDAFGTIGEYNKPSVYYNSTNGNKNDVFGEYGSYPALSPYAYAIKNPDGSWAYSNYQLSQAAYVTPNIIERLTLDGYNRNNTNNAVLSTQATQDLNSVTKGLTAKVLLAYTSNYSTSVNLTRTNLPSYVYDPVANTYTPAFSGVYRLEKLNTSYSPGSTVRKIAAQGSLNYDRSFKQHHINALVLYSLSSTQNSLPTTVNGVNNPNYLTYNYVPNNTLGTSVRTTYDYKSKYIVTLTGAYNGTSRFSSSKSYGLFPVISAAYNIAEESFFKQRFKFIDQLKFRSSYGLVGSDQFSANQLYSYQQTYSTTNGASSGAFNSTYGTSFGTSIGTLPFNTGILEGTLPNGNVTWEKSKQFDVGVDFSFFNHLNGLFDYFKYNRYDQLIQRGTVSAIFGQDLPPVNIGRTSTRGFEVELNYNNKIGNNFTYNFRGTFSKVNSRVDFKDEASTQYPWQTTTGHTLYAQGRFQFLGFYSVADMTDPTVAKPLGVLARPGDLKYKDINGDGVIDSKDQVVSDVTNTPVNTFGFQTRIGYKGFSLSILLQGATGYNVLGSGEAIRAFSANLQPIHQQAWTPELGNNAKYPALGVLSSISDPSAYPSDFWSIPGDYLRIRTMEIGYSLPAKLVQRARLQGVRVYFNGNNLYTWSNAYKLYALDPEASYGTNEQNYPPQRLYNLGLSIVFN